ncbi:MAG: hypothetical protein KC619_10095 [Myxococcales bacterium]|nr:hypothetical protein [Myxococcales bacterium]
MHLRTPLLLAFLAGSLAIAAAGCDTGPPPIPPLPDAGPTYDGGSDAGGPNCDNGAKDGDETGIDCGGSCDGCADGDPCNVPADCDSLVCMRGRCLVPTCTDEVRNGSETGTDCGGDCGLCPGGEPCTSNDQCISGRCRGAVCADSTCDDGRMNADETDIDCGGPLCPACRGGETCETETDCTSLICAGGTCTEPACNDGVQNQDETSVDCGGGFCPACRDGLACMVDRDCEGMRCLDGGCVSCMDRVRNAEETDVDCGGPLCSPCRDGLVCTVDTDCENSFCHMGTCISCSDGTMNFDETDVDCGGTRCTGCLNGRMCGDNMDCLSNDCMGGLCRGRGDTCTDIVTLTTGLNTVNWVATANDYMVANPSCSSQTREGPDVVMQYTATVDGFVTFDIAKPASNRWTMLVSDQTCGMPTPELLCQSRYTETSMSGQIAVTAGTTYTFYLADTNSGTLPLSNPLLVTIDEIVPPCTPGMGGVVGNGVTRRTTGLTSISEYFVEADDSPTGYVYFGGTTQLYRMPKAGGAVETVTTLAGISSTRLGYAMVVAGNDIFTLETLTTGTTGRLYRISSDGGATWITGGQDYATFDGGAAQPNDDFRGATADPTGARLYLITEESSLVTEIWSVPLGATTVPVTGRLEAAIPSYLSCSGLAMDASYYYTACYNPTPQLIRIDRTTMAVTVLSSTVPVSSLINSIHADDNTSDGVADALYVNVGTEDAYYVCGLSATPFAAPFVSWGGATSNYGLGFDPAANRLYGIDDDTRELVIIE